MLKVKNYGANCIHLQGHQVDENNSTLIFLDGRWDIRIAPESSLIGVMVAKNIHGYAVLNVIHDLLDAYNLMQPIASLDIWTHMCRLDSTLREGDVEKVRPKS